MEIAMASLARTLGHPQRLRRTARSIRQADLVELSIVNAQGVFRETEARASGSLEGKRSDRAAAIVAGWGQTQWKLTFACAGPSLRYREVWLYWLRPCPASGGALLGRLI